jgi:transposase InsO family protein
MAKVKKLRQSKRIQNEFLNLQYDHAHSNFNFPSKEKLIAIQQRSSLVEEDMVFLDKNLVHMSLVNDLLYYKDVIWIPSSERFVILCVMITAHDSRIGHKSFTHTLDLIRSKFFWSHMRDDIHEFVSHCLSCAKTKTGELIPRPWGRTMVSTKFNQIVHFDYLYIDKSLKSRHLFEYVLVLKDDFTGFVELIPCEHADHINIVTALQAWQSRFGKIGTLVSDQGSHFCNLMMSEYAKRCFPLPIDHHFTIAYTPWSNGTVERVMRDIIALFRRILHTHENIDMWPYLLSHVMSVINGRKQVSLGDHSPRELVIGHDDDFTLDILFDPLLDQLHNIVVNSSYDEFYNNLVLSLREMHREASLATEVVRKRNAKAQLRKVPINFGIGDFVLVAIVNKQARKLHALWRGPYRIIGSKSSHVYMCEDLTLNIVLEVHVSRMKFFAISDMNVSVSLKQTISAQDTWDTKYIPECILDSYVDASKEIFVRVKWSGFSELETTWEPIKSFFFDCPNLVHEFLLLKKHNHDALRKYVHDEQELHERKEAVKYKRK